jgi:hypothetical protein
MPQVKRVIQTIYYFSYEEVQRALESSINDDRHLPGDLLKPHISAGLNPGSGLTLLYQSSKELTPHED